MTVHARNAEQLVRIPTLNDGGLLDRASGGAEAREWAPANEIHILANCLQACQNRPDRVCDSRRGAPGEQKANWLLGGGGGYYP